MKAVETLITDNIAHWALAVQKRNATGRGSSKKIDLYGIKKLRELILELAVRGKLVSQNSGDEPASVLLKRIAVERALLIKDKKIKKSKKLPEITKSDVPANLPCGWGYARLMDISQVDMGNSPPGSTYNDIGDGVPLINGPVEFSPGPFGKTRRVKFTTAPSIMCETGDILVCVRGATTGRTNISAFPACVGRGVARVKAFINQDFINLLMWQNQYKLLAKGTGTTFPSVSYVDLAGHQIWLPPLAEQHSIVAKVNELMSLCDQLEQQTETSLTAHTTLVENLLATLTTSTNAAELEQNWNRIAEHFPTLFPADTRGEASIDLLKQTVLQLAVMGKLVPQNPNDEPASALLEKIAAEKAQLIKEKKIKKQKALPPISEDEKPFELPAGWAFARFEDIVDIQGGITKGRKLAGRDLLSVPYLRVANVQRSYLELGDMKEVEIPVEEKEKYEVKRRDLLITEGGDWDKVGRTAIWSGELPYVAHQNHVFKARIFLEEQSEDWLEKYLNAPFARSYFAGSSKQTTNLASINKTQLRGCLIAIPPTNEKNRIVQKLGQLITLCDQIKTHLQQAQQTRLHLADAVTGQFFGHSLPRTEQTTEAPKDMKISTLLTLGSTKVSKDAPLALLVQKAKGEADAKVIWSQSKLALPEFYKQLKKEIDAGYLAQPAQADFE